jgi:predicted ABC-type ATPase
MLEEIAYCINAGESFAFETTLSGRSYAVQIPKWREAGNCVDLVFLRLRSVRLAIARVKMRVAQGGHHIPASVVRRRFHLGLRNFHELYCPLVNRWRLYDNSEGSPRLLEMGENE